MISAKFKRNSYISKVRLVVVTTAIKRHFDLLDRTLRSKINILRILIYLLRIIGRAFADHEYKIDCETQTFICDGVVFVLLLLITHF